MKGMAAEQPSHPHHAAAQRAVALNRFASIFGTSRNKSARRRQPGRDYDFVESQERNKNDAHRLYTLNAASLGPSYLGNDVAKLAEARSFI